MAKKYLVKVYSKSGAYLNTWDEVISDISFQNEINTAGGQMTLILARKAGDYGEGSDIDFGYKVKVYVFDKELPNGDIVFQGYISAYTPIYKDDSVQITVLSFGSELNDYMIDGVPITDISQTSENREEQIFRGDTLSGGATYVMRGQTFIPTTAQNLSAIVIRMRRDAGTPLALAKPIIRLHTQPGFYDPNDIPLDRTDYMLAEKQIELTSTTMTNITVSFDKVIPLTSGKEYFFSIQMPFSSGALNFCYIAATTPSAYANGSSYYSYGPGSIAAQQWFPASGGSFPVGDLYFQTIYISNATKAAFNSYDPGNIARQLTLNASQNGANITYDDTTIELTSTTVSYTFNVNTILQGIQKCVELAPADWYWYVDYSNNKVNFHKKTDLPKHTFSLEKDILDAKFEKRIEDVINTIYFTGGLSGGSNLYKKYTKSDSITKYGVKALKYTDQRVTTTATADTIANAILATRSEPELRVTLEILDSNNEQGLGYDIESIEVGDTIAVRNITQTVGLSTWDVARWDEAYWDYSIYNLSSLNMQVQRIEYNQDRARLYASTIAVDVNKRIEDINRNLEQSIVTNNPTAPS